MPSMERAVELNVSSLPSTSDVYVLFGSIYNESCHNDRVDHPHFKSSSPNERSGAHLQRHIRRQRHLSLFDE